MCHAATRLGITKLYTITSRPSSAQPPNVATRVLRSVGESWESHRPCVAAVAGLCEARGFMRAPPGAPGFRVAADSNCACCENPEKKIGSAAAGLRPRNRPRFGRNLLESHASKLPAASGGSHGDAKL